MIPQELIDQVDNDVIEVFDKYTVQKAYSPREMYLTPNEVFFDKNGTLRCVIREGTSKGDSNDEYNKYRYFDYITNTKL